MQQINNPANNRNYAEESEINFNEQIAFSNNATNNSIYDHDASHHSNEIEKTVSSCSVSSVTNDQTALLS